MQAFLSDFLLNFQKNQNFHMKKFLDPITLNNEIVFSLKICYS